MEQAISIPEVVSSILTFVGGGLLTIDVFSPVRAFYTQLGDEKWHWLVSKLPGKAAADPKAVDKSKALAHAKRSQCLTRWGFVLITGGFLIDVLNKLHVHFSLWLDILRRAI
jgi:hypothetical protein